MEVVFENNGFVLPKVSIILLDWSCRESFHILEYLKNQTIPREQYEIIWIEYYGRRPIEIKTALEECKKSGKAPVVDKWIVMDMPDDTYYHKHLMYNVGIVAGKGKIVAICDSDAVVSPTFAETIIEAFQANPSIVLHMDEVKNIDRRFYPFNYPSISQISGKGCINWENGKTIGLLDKEDFLHTRNYGACMCAFRKDLIDIGGADEHIDYLGHICGPYDMTFRLINAGKKEIWHQNEFLYHVWHPGTDGDDNYLGPHDGKNMSTVALDVRSSGRIMPLVENPAIKILRTNGETVLYDSLLSQSIPELELTKWKPRKVISGLKQNFTSYISMCKSFKKKPEYFLKCFTVNLTLYKAIMSLIAKQIYSKIVKRPGNEIRAMQKGAFLNFLLLFIFPWRMFKNSIYTVRICRQALNRLGPGRVKKVAVYGTGFTARILYILTKKMSLKISNIYDKSNVGSEYLGFEILPLQSLREYSGKIIIASFISVLEKAAELKGIGIEEENIVKLQ